MPDIDMRPRPMAETLMPLLPSSRCCMASPLEKIEIFPVFPVAHFEVEARDLGFLDAAPVVDEGLAEAFHEAFIFSQCGERVAGLPGPPTTRSSAPRFSLPQTMRSGASE